MGMYLMRQIGTRGVYGNPMLPDFMVFLNWKELPWYWWGFDHFGFAALMVCWCRACWRWSSAGSPSASRVTGVYLSIITQAMTYALMLAFFRNDMGFGGNNGLTDFKDMLGFNVQAPATRASALYRRDRRWRSLLGFLLCRVHRARSKLGRVLVAMRDAESRDALPRLSAPSATSCSSSRSRRCMAGIAGALYVPQVGIINPREFAPANSIEVVIWVAVGGRGTLVGRVARRRAGQLRARPGFTGAAARALAVRARRAVRRSSRCSCRSGIVGSLPQRSAASAGRNARDAELRRCEARHA